MRIEKNNVISYTPDQSGFLAQFQADASAVWTEKVYGFAVIPIWAGWSPDASAPPSEADESDLVETMIVPVVFDSGWLLTAPAYALDRPGTRFLGLVEPH